MTMVAFGNVRLYKIIVIGILILLAVPLLTHHYLTLVGNESGPKTPNSNFVDDPGSSGEFIIQLRDVDKLEGADLKYRIEELVRIKSSVGLELHSLEAKRRQIQLDITTYTKRLNEFKVEAGHKKNELDRLQISLEQAKVAEKEAMERNTPRLGRPKGLGQLRYREFLSVTSSSASVCNMDNCFDYSLCPISNLFSFYLYPASALSVSLSANVSAGASHENNQHSAAAALYHSISLNNYITTNPYKSCLYLLILDNCSPGALKALNTLLYWNGDGRNHVIWPTCSLSADMYSALWRHSGRAAILTQTPNLPRFRLNFDLITSYLDGGSSTQRLVLGADVLHLPPMTPAKRKYLATYLGASTDASIQSELLKIQQEDPLSFVFQFSCASAASAAASEPLDLETDQESNKNDASKKLSDLCNNDLLRTRLLIDSTFSLIILSTSPSASGPEDHKFGSGSGSEMLQLRIFESLKYGAIPILLGTNHDANLPFTEVLDWNRLVITLPWARITELHYLLKYVSDADLLTFRRNGRLVYEKYLNSVPSVVDTVLAVFRTRIGLPSRPYKDVRWKSVFNDSFIPLKMESVTLDPEDEENLGPIEPPYPSTSFTRNFTGSNLERYASWNVHMDVFQLYPYSPWDTAGSMPSEAKFKGSSVGFRPIGGGSGGAGKEFSESLGGNLPKEQFTIVMLTYERESVLINSLERLYLLPYLNKVLVVWNSEKGPSPELKWPDIGVPVKIVQAPRNSLNNRFLPFEAIETEAILSIDDDAHLRHDEIVFGFRVWREHRDRIVGFPGRFHAWDLGNRNWLYNSNYSCELSMVLTGAAFHHKIYSYLYTYEMPAIIRDKVDELMNCEDIAMNFLVSHLTQKPPVKVTSRWTFRCPGCPVTLSEDDSHFQERHACINFFSQVYGYTPLLYTQYRADSILFKTRIPHDKQKCFKYI